MGFLLLMFFDPTQSGYINTEMLLINSFLFKNTSVRLPNYL